MKILHLSKESKVLQSELNKIGISRVCTTNDSEEVIIETDCSMIERAYKRILSNINTPINSRSTFKSPHSKDILSMNFSEEIRTSVEVFLVAKDHYK